MTCSVTWRATFSCASPVEAARCGVTTTLGWRRSAPSSGGGGSWLNTSSAAPPTFPLSSAARSAASSTIPPRAQLTTSTPSRHLASVRSSRRPRVASLSGVWNVSTSLSAKSVSRSTSPMPSRSAASSESMGSNPSVRIPKPCILRATSRPTFPTPTTPSVLPSSSVPEKLLRSHAPPLSEADACGICRATASSIAHVCSAVEIVLPSGALRTSTPLRVAASRSTLSTPTPARPITFRLGAASRRPAVIVVPLRMIQPSARAASAFSSSSVFFRCVSTSIPASARRS